MRALVIGCCALDVYVDIDRLPTRGEDVNTRDLRMSLGGMAYNVFNVLDLFGTRPILGCPIGEGPRADIVAGMLARLGRRPIGVIPGQDNGMCLCLVDDSRERSFISHHGAEYRFDPAHFDGVDFDQVAWIYACGLEIEDVDGEAIVRFLEEKGRPLFLAPGPRLDKVPPRRLERLYDLHPVLHINEREAGLIAGGGDPWDNIRAIARRTGNTVVLTLGDRGTLLMEAGKEPLLIPTRKVEMVDATGAGDNHAGAVLSGLLRGLDWPRAVEAANCISGYVVRQKGAALTGEAFRQAQAELRQRGLL